MTKDVTFIFKDTKEVNDVIEKLMEKSGLSKSDIIRIALHSYLNQIGGKDGSIR